MNYVAIDQEFGTEVATVQASSRLDAEKFFMSQISMPFRVEEEPVVEVNVLFS